MTSIYADAARFINLVAKMADKTDYPRVISPDVLHELNHQPYANPCYLDQLPAAVQCMAYNYLNPTYSSWLGSTKILEPPLADAGQESVRRQVIENTARSHLNHLKQPIDPARPPSEQLLTLIFRQAFSPVYSSRNLPSPSDTPRERKEQLERYLQLLRERDEQLEQMLQLAHDLAPKLDPALAFKVNRSKYRAASVPFNLIFNNFVGALIFSFVTYKIIRWSQLRVWDYLCRTLKDAPVVTITANAVTTMGKYRDSALHLFTAAIAGAKKYKFLDFLISPWEPVGTAISFCARCPFKAQFWIIVCSGRVGYLSDQALKSFMAEKRKKYLEKGSELARWVWMDLTINRAQAGVLKPSR